MSTCTLFCIRKYDPFRHVSTPECAGFVHERVSVMATIRQLPSGHWHVQIRLKGRKATETFLRHDHAREWATETEAKVDRGHAPSGRRARSAKTFGALIDLHIDDMKEVGKTPGRSKSATLEMLQRRLGALRISDLDRERLIRFGRDRARI